MTMELKKSFSARNVILLAIIAISFSSCTFPGVAKRSYAKAESKAPYDVIIVPGLPYDKEKTSAVLKMRMFWARYLYKEGIARNIIFSGSAVYTPFVESVAMRAIADSLGIPSKYTYAETEAEHSTENVYYSWKMARGLGFKKIALATDPFQSAVLRGFIRKHTPGVDVIPIVYDRIDLKGKDLPIIDTTSSYKTNFVSIKEREGFIERIRGTFGKRIKEEKRLEAKRKQELYTGN